MESLGYWLYASRSAVPKGSADRVVGQIVEVSRARNGGLAISGALIFTGAYFAQYIEGSTDGLGCVRRSILADVRHADIRTLGEGHVNERRFANWSLAFARDTNPFDRLIALAHGLEGQGGQTLLMEMLRRFTGLTGAVDR